MAISSSQYNQSLHNLWVNPKLRLETCNLNQFVINQYLDTVKFHANDNIILK